MYPRFSLLSLFLVVTLVAVSISHWKTSRELRVKQIIERHRPYESLQLLARERPDQIHVLGTFSVLLDGERYTHIYDLDWILYLSKSKKWRLCWTAGELPSMKKEGNSYLELERTADGCSQIWVTIRKDASGGAKVHLGQKYHDKETIITTFEDIVPSERSQWLKRGLDFWDHAGAYSTIESHVQSFDITSRIKLLQPMRVLPGEPIRDSQVTPEGLFVWLEPED